MDKAEISNGEDHENDFPYNFRVNILSHEQSLLLLIKDIMS